MADYTDTLSVTQDNLNLTKTNLYVFRLHKTPKVSYNCTSVTLPGLSLGSSIQSSPIRDVNIPGDTLVYDDLSLNFLVDEDFVNWLEIYNWMKALGTPENTNQYDSTLSGGVLFMTTNNRNVNKKFEFFDLFPVNLTSVDLNLQDGNPVESTVTFQYNYFQIS